MSKVSSTGASKRSTWVAVYAGVALTTASTLVLELSLTRLFSVIFYYHFAFLAISIALFGLGAGGVISYLVPQRGRALCGRLGMLCAINALLIPVVLIWLLNRGGDCASFSALAGVYLAASLPFLISGITIALAIAETMERVEQVYFWDLAGAAGGCLLLIPVLNIAGAPGAVLASAVLSAAAAAVWYGLAGAVRRRAMGVTMALALFALLVYNKQGHVIDLESAKGARLGQELFVQWNSFSRVAVKRSLHDERLKIAIDADSTTAIAPFNIERLSNKERDELAGGGPALVYKLRPAPKTLIVGAGGGWDVARALAAGSHDVTAVEINPIIARTIMQRRFADASHGLYLQPEVRVEVEDGRSYVRRSVQRYQVIQATLVDTWASTAAGAYALSENTLYTVDAFTENLEHLTRDGIVTFTRWGFVQPRESLRLVAVAREALGRVGQREAWRNIAVLREHKMDAAGFGALDTVLVARTPFADADLECIRGEAARQGFDVLYAPGDAATNAFAQLLTSSDVERFYESYPYDVRPVDDDRPFFFYTVQARDAWNYVRNFNHASEDFKINLAVPTLFALLGVSAASTLITLLLPPVLLGARLPRERGVARFLLYFVALGAGYVLVQISLIQKLVLLLGHPTYALAVVIFTMLLASGAGSYASRRMLNREERRLRLVPLAVAFAVAVLAFSLTPLSGALATTSTAVRVLVAMLLVAPAGFLMGMPFPGGLALLETWNREAVKWAWSMNAAASVLGSALAVLIAIYAGLRATTLTGAACYVGAWALILVTARFRTQSGEQQPRPCGE